MNASSQLNKFEHQIFRKLKMEIPECFTLKEAQFFTLLNTRKNTNEAKERMIKFCLKAKKKTLKYDVKLLSDKEQFLMALSSILQGDKKLVNYGCDTNPRSADKMHDETLPGKSMTKQSLKSAGVQSESEMYMKQGSIDDQLQQDLKKSIAELDQAKEELEYLKGQKCCNPTLLQSQIFQLKRQLEILKDRETEKEVFVYNINENLQMIKIKLQEIVKDNPHNEISLIVKQLSSTQKHMQRREKQLKDVKPSAKIKTQINIPEIELQYESLYKKLKALKCNVETSIQPNILPLFKDRNEEMFRNALDELEKAMKSLIQISSTLCYQDSKLSSKDVKSQVEESFNLSNFVSNIPLSQSSKELVSSYFEPLFFKYEKIHVFYILIIEILL
jgi:hypothetical protein